jgi:hypothetical protein
MCFQNLSCFLRWADCNSLLRLRQLKNHPRAGPIRWRKHRQQDTLHRLQVIVPRVVIGKLATPFAAATRSHPNTATVTHDQP